MAIFKLEKGAWAGQCTTKLGPAHIGYDGVG